MGDIWVASKRASTGLGGIVAWSPYSRAGARNWHKVASIPSGVLLDFCVAEDGSSLYLQTDTDTRTLYQCTNPKAASPVWTPIAYNGLATPYGTLVPSGGGELLDAMVTRGTTLAIGAHQQGQSPQWLYGEYNGTAWTWRSMGDVSMFGPPRVGYDSWADANLHLYNGSAGLIETLTAPYDFQDIRAEVYHRAGLPRYFTVTKGDNHIYLRIASTSDTDLGTTTLVASRMQDTRIRGAHAGVQVYVVNSGSGDPGALWVSDNGSTFTRLVAWKAGWVEDDIRAGGGYFVWVNNAGITETPTMARLYNRSGTLIDDLTGDFWTLPPAENQTFVGMGLTYDRGEPIIVNTRMSALETGGIGLQANGVVIVHNSTARGSGSDVGVTGSGVLYADNLDYGVSAITAGGVIEPLAGDRAAWDAVGYPARHTNDADTAGGIHHSLGDLDTRYQSKALTNTHILVGNAGNVATDVALSNDATLANTGALTLATVNSDVGSFVGANITVNAKGLITAASNGTPAHTGQHLEVVMAPGITPPDPVLNPAGDDYLYEWVSD